MIYTALFIGIALGGTWILLYLSARSIGFIHGCLAEMEEILNELEQLDE